MVEGQAEWFHGPAHHFGQRRRERDRVEGGGLGASRGVDIDKGETARHRLAIMEMPSVGIPFGRRGNVAGEPLPLLAKGKRLCDPVRHRLRRDRRGGQQQGKGEQSLQRAAPMVKL